MHTIYSPTIEQDNMFMFPQVHFSPTFHINCILWSFVYKSSLYFVPYHLFPKKVPKVWWIVEFPLIFTAPRRSKWSLGHCEIHLHEIEVIGSWAPSGFLAKWPVVPCCMGCCGCHDVKEIWIYEVVGCKTVSPQNQCQTISLSMALSGRLAVFGRLFFLTVVLAVLIFFTEPWVWINGSEFPFH